MRSPKEKETEEYKGCRPFEEESARFPDDSALGRHVDGSALGTEAKRRCLKEAALADFAGDETSNRGSSSKSACLKPPGVGESLAAVFPWVASMLVRSSFDLGLPMQCMTQPMGDLFPLPTNMGVLEEALGATPVVAAAVRSLCMALNSLYGSPLENDFPPIRLQLNVLKFLKGQAEEVQQWAERFVSTDWHSFFQLKTVDYSGDEVLCAQYTSWENLDPAMPTEIASVPLSSVCDLGCRHYVENFSQYLLPEELQQSMKAPRVMISDEAWPGVCQGLVDRRVCILLKEKSLFHIGDAPLLNGLFGVPKGEDQGGIPIHRLIMDLRPCNLVCRGMEGDVSTLPSWATMGPMQLMPHESLVISSEDARCFFYIFQVPLEWSKFLAFNRPTPREMWPDEDGPYYLASQVLPMGFKNSVSLAQHVHRAMVRRAGEVSKGVLRPEQEIRKDRPFTASRELHRVYLDNFDCLEKMDARTAKLLQGEPGPGVLALRNEYEHWGVPRHPKKAVARSVKAEVQGAIIDGERGIAYPKRCKVMKYVELASLLVGEKRCWKQAEVVAGGLVYMSMFRRPLLGSLNAIWRFIESFKGYPPVIKLEIPPEVKLEVSRFIGLVPLACMDFRLEISKEVTASDASTTGGGLTRSTGITGYGQAAAFSWVRGDLAEPSDLCGVLTVGLFDGIGALRVAADACQLPVIGHISVEVNKEASRVLESKFPASLIVPEGVEAVDEEMVKTWACRYSQVSLVILGAGPPCQGVSGLNADRRGALRDHRSGLFIHVRRIRDLLKRHFPWAQIRYLAESVSSMDQADREVMSRDFGDPASLIDAKGVSLARRPRLYWCDWELTSSDAVRIHRWQGEGPGRFRQVDLDAVLEPKDYLGPGCRKVSEEPFPTFTTARPREFPGRRPAGIEKLTEEEKEAWAQDKYRFPPYQYSHRLLVQQQDGQCRIPTTEEREVIMGFPKGYTLQCMPKQAHGSEAHEDTRKTLIGNSWNVTVVVWLLAQLGAVLGLCPSKTPQEAVDATKPGGHKTLGGVLQKPSMRKVKKEGTEGEYDLVAKLLNMVSLKGEDIMVQAPTEETLRYHRLRASLPSTLWSWKTVMGWRWNDASEHINVLEMRAVLTSLRWRAVKRRAVQSKFVHLVDSLVCLHSLSRGRSSSRKLRRTLSRVNALLLASGSHCVWAYVHTKDNPADRPSRRPVRKKW